MSSPQKIAHMHYLKKENLSIKRKLTALRRKLEDITSKEGVELDDDMSADLLSIMKKQQPMIDEMEEGSFKKVYFNQQKEAALKHKNGMHWYPLMIQWCLYIQHLSSKTYDTLRASGCLHLPSQRTLRDYSHCYETRIGFSDSVDEQILKAAKLSTSPEYHKLVLILMNEMHIKEGLVYDKHTGSITGFIDLGSVNNQLLSFEKAVCGKEESSDDLIIPTLAKSMMVYMVRGLFSSLQFAYAQFSCSSLTGELLFEGSSF